MLKHLVGRVLKLFLMELDVVPNGEDADLGDGPLEETVLGPDRHDTNVTICAVECFCNSSQVPLLGRKVILLDYHHRSNFDVVPFLGPFRPVVQVGQVFCFPPPPNSLHEDLALLPNGQTISRNLL